MAIVYDIGNKIECKYSRECKDYSRLHGGGKISKCVSCKNNEYEEPRKESYYEPELNYSSFSTIIFLGCLISLVILFNI